MRSLILILALSIPSIASAQIEPHIPGELVSSLTERVSGFYRDFQEGEFRRAESFVDEESKELYYNVRKTRIMGHEIKGFTWSDDFRSVRVMVTALTLMPMMGSKPLPQPVGSEWRLIDGEWFMHLTPPDERRSTPFGTVNPTAAATGAVGTGGLQQNGKAAPSVASLQRLISLGETEIEFPSGATEPLVHVIEVTSGAPEGFRLKVEPLRTAARGLNVVMDPETIEPGGKGTLTVTYDAAENRLSGRRRLDFEVSPTGQRLRVTINFTQPDGEGAPESVEQ
jgi:hypothetical protein